MVAIGYAKMRVVKDAMDSWAQCCAELPCIASADLSFRCQRRCDHHPKLIIRYAMDVLLLN